MTLNAQSILERLQPLANDKTKGIYTRQGIKETILGINRTPLRQMAKEIGQNHDLALDLWRTGIFEARLLASMLFDPKRFTLSEVEDLVRSTLSLQVLDEFTFDVFEDTPAQTDLFETWRKHTEPCLRRSAWNMAVTRVIAKQLKPEQLEDLLGIIEQELMAEDPDVQYAMNRCLCEIGIRYDALTERCIAIGRTLGLYKEMKVAKGCTSPYAPDWITVARRNRGK